MEDAFEDVEELVGVERLADVLVGAGLERPDPVRAERAGQTITTGISSVAADPRSSTRTVRPSIPGIMRSSAITSGSNDSHQRQAARRVHGRCHVVTGPREHALAYRADVVVVFDDEDRTWRPLVSMPPLSPRERSRLSSGRSWVLLDPQHEKHGSPASACQPSREHRAARSLAIPHGTRREWVGFVPGREGDMDIKYLHASKFGNGVMVAREFKEQMAARGDHGLRAPHPRRRVRWVGRRRPLPVQLAGPVRPPDP